MKNRFVTLVMMLVAGVSMTGDLKGQVYQIDNAHTSVVFAINHFGLSYIYGRFNQCRGSFRLNNGELTADGLEFVIDAASIDTNNKERDAHLRGPDFFDTQQFPSIKFTAKNLKKVGNQFQISGELEMHGVKRPITLPVQLVGTGPGPFGKQRAGCYAKFMLKRSEFGMDNMLQSLGDTVSITFCFEGIVEEEEEEEEEAQP